MNRHSLSMITAAASWTLPVPLALALQEGGHEEADHAHAPGETHESHAGAHEPVGAIPTVKQGLMTGITALVVFGIVLLVLATKVWPKITRGLDERARKIREEIAAAEDARRAAAAALESYQQSLAEARAEAQKMLEDARSQQQSLAADLKAKADAELNDMRDKARRDIEAAKRAALSEIFASATDMATDIAAKILAREVNAHDHQRLVAESLSELQAASS